MGYPADFVVLPRALEGVRGVTSETSPPKVSREPLVIGKRLHDYRTSPCFMGQSTIYGDFPLYLIILYIYYIIMYINIIS